MPNHTTMSSKRVPKLTDKVKAALNEQLTNVSKKQKENSMEEGNDINVEQPLMAKKTCTTTGNNTTSSSMLSSSTTTSMTNKDAIVVNDEKNSDMEGELETTEDELSK